MSMRMIFFSVISIGLVMGIAVGQTSGSAKDPKAKADSKVPSSIFDGRLPPAFTHPKVAPPDPAPAEKSQKAPEAPAPPGSAQAAPAAEPAAPAAPMVTVERVDAPPQELKEVTAEDIARVKVGSSEKELKAILGNPASRVEIPDDDGRLNVTMQYWGNGKLQGIVRMENGKVVSVEGRK